jgi:hypothetical protein
MDNKREDPFWVGDRVIMKWPDDDEKYPGIVIADRKKNGKQCVMLDDYFGGGGPGGSYVIDSDKTVELISPSTEPQAQEETRMKAYQWVIWNVDENGTRLSIAEWGGYVPYASEQHVKMEAWANFKATTKGAELKDYEVEIHPFGG